MSAIGAKRTSGGYQLCSRASFAAELLRGVNVCFGGKAGIIRTWRPCLLLIQSRHWRSQFNASKDGPFIASGRGNRLLTVVLNVSFIDLKAEINILDTLQFLFVAHTSKALPAIGTRIVIDPIPHYIDERQSDLRGV